MGPEVQKFEEEIKDYINTDLNVVCVNTGTSALHLALHSLDIKEGDEVLVPSLTYVASYQAISATGATPISCDIEPHTGFIDLKDAEKRITNKTKAIMPVHYASHSSSIPEVYELAKKYNLRVVEDAAHSFGCLREGKIIGQEGDIICFSFDGIKNITSGEGGAILTADEEVLTRAKDGRLLGVEKDSDNRYRRERSWNFNVSRQGFRYHMSDLFAAIGREQLKRCDELFKRRKAHLKQYITELQNLAEIETLELDYDNLVPHIFIIKATKRRDELFEFLKTKGVQVGLHYAPNHLLNKFKTDYSLPVTESLSKEIITLPLHPDLTSDDITYVTDAIKEFLSND